MSRSIHITIPTPCHERWDHMDSTNEGAFCHSCQKQVIDFSAITDREVVDYLSKNQTGCGRFRMDQLSTKLTMPKVDNGLFRWKALFLSFLSLISIKNLVAQSIPNATINEPNIVLKSSKDSFVNNQYHPNCLPEVEIKASAVKKDKHMVGTYIEIAAPLDSVKRR